MSKSPHTAKLQTKVCQEYVDRDVSYKCSTTILKDQLSREMGKSQFRSAISEQGRATMNFRFDCSKKGTSAEVPFIQIYSFCFTNPYFTFTRSNFSSIGSAATHRKKAVAAPCTTSIGKPDI